MCQILGNFSVYYCKSLSNTFSIWATPKRHPRDLKFESCGYLILIFHLEGGEIFFENFWHISICLWATLLRNRFFSIVYCTYIRFKQYSYLVMYPSQELFTSWLVRSKCILETSIFHLNKHISESHQSDVHRREPIPNTNFI